MKETKNVWEVSGKYVRAGYTKDFTYILIDTVLAKLSVMLDRPSTEIAHTALETQQIVLFCIWEQWKEGVRLHIKMQFLLLHQ